MATKKKGATVQKGPLTVKTTDGVTVFSLEGGVLKGIQYTGHYMPKVELRRALMGEEFTVYHADQVQRYTFGTGRTEGKGHLYIGCMVFNKTEEKKLRKFAGVK